MSLPAVVGVLLAVGLCLGAVTAFSRRSRFEARTKLPSLPPAPAGDRWLAALPIRVVAVDHRPRERRTCTCQSVAFAADVGDRQTWFGVSASSLAAWHRHRRGFHLAHRAGLGRLRAVTALEQAYGLLTRNHYTTSVDNLPIPSGWRHKLRMIFADHSSIVVTVPGNRNARLFVETFTRLRDDVGLRILGALAAREQPALDGLDDEAGVPAAALTGHLSVLADAGYVRLGPGTAELTDRGRAVLAERVRYIAAMARFVQVDDIRVDFTGG